MGRDRSRGSDGRSPRKDDPADFLREEAALGRFCLEARAIVGFSGGPDSTALLAALVEAGAPNLRALHVDHGLRPEAERHAELETVRNLAARLKVPLTVARVRPGAIEELAERSGEGIEAAARRYRYAALRTTAARTGAEAIYLAHTRDDQLETVLMRFLSGSGAAGLRGMPRESGLVVRPFLGLSKTELLAYLERRGLPFSTDSTNAGEDYARNRLRHRVLPVLERFFPGWEAGVGLSARKAGMDEEALALRAGGFAFGWQGRNLVAGAALLDEPDAVRYRALLSAAGSLSKGRRVPFRLVEAAFAALDSGARSYRGGGLEFRREGDRLMLASALDFPGYRGYFVEIADPGSGRLERGAGRIRVSASWQRGGTTTGLRRDAFSFPLVVRSRRPGDELAIRGGSKRLDVLFSEWGVATADRDRIPVLEDRDGVVAVLGAGYGGRDRYRHNDGCESDVRLSIQVKGA
jgi:tRNA(Ile)-lysidine synthase